MRLHTFALISFSTWGFTRLVWGLCALNVTFHVSVWVSSYPTFKAKDSPLQCSNQQVQQDSAGGIQCPCSISAQRNLSLSLPLHILPNLLWRVVWGPPKIALGNAWGKKGEDVPLHKQKYLSSWSEWLCATLNISPLWVLTAGVADVVPFTSYWTTTSISHSQHVQ